VDICGVFAGHQSLPFSRTIGFDECVEAHMLYLVRVAPEAEDVV
jgi:hypothetical protein